MLTHGYRRNLHRLPLALLLLLLLWCGWHIGRTIFDSLHTYGDAGAEGALLMGVRNFLRYGFVRTHFLPIHNSSPTAPFDLVASWTYDRYPPGSDLIAGAIAYVTGSEQFWPLRILPTLASLTAVYLLFRLSTDVLKNAWLALLVAFAYAMNYSFMKMADSFYYTGYAEMLRMLVPLAALRWRQAAPPSRRWLAILIVASFVNVWITFDYVPGNFVTSCLLVALFGAPDRSFMSFVWTAFITAVPIVVATLAAMFTRLVQNGWAHGSISDALHELYVALLHRVFNVTPVPSEPLDLASIVHVVVHRTQFSFNLDWIGVLTALAILLALLLLARRWPLVQRYGMLLLAFVAGNFAYMLMLPAWAREHYGIIGIRHILPTYAMLVGGGVFFALWLVVGESGRQLARDLGETWRTRGISSRLARLSLDGVARLVAAMFIVVTLGSTLLWNFNDTRMMWRTSAQNSWAERFAAIDALREHLPVNAVAFGNAHWFRPEARYRFDRLASAIITMDDLRNNEEWLPLDDPRKDFKGKPPQLPPGEFEGYFAFYQRWDPPEDGFFPNFGPTEAAGLARDRNILAWLNANAEFVTKYQKWTLFRLKRLPTEAEAAPPPAAAQK